MGKAPRVANALGRGDGGLAPRALSGPRAESTPTESKAPRVASALGRTSDVDAAAPQGPRTASALTTAEGVAGAQAAGGLPLLDLLLSFAFHSRLDHREVRSRLPEGSLIWIDSGAFTAFTTGKQVTREEYADHLRAQRGGYDYAFSLDVIGDPKASRKNTEWLWEQGLKVVPVFHFGSPLDEWRSLCREYGYVAAGGLVPLAKDRQRVTAYLRHLTRIAEEYGTAVHALGTAGRQTVLATRVWSADSSTVSSAPQFGIVPVYDQRRKRLVMLRARDKEGLWRHRRDLLRYGFPLDVIMREGKWTSAERPAMFRTSLLGVAQMWQDVREAYEYPAPERLWAPEGGQTDERPDGPRPSYSAFPSTMNALNDILGPHGDRATGAADSGDLAEEALAPGKESR